MTFDRNLSKIPLLSFEETRQLFKCVAEGDTRAKQKLMKHNLRLVARLANIAYRQTSSRYLEIGDLIQEGSIGLAHAIDKFDATLGYQFSTYATFWIRRYIYLAFMRDRVVRIPVGQYERFHLIKKVAKDFHLVNNRYPSESELAELANLSVDMIKDNLKHFQAISSLDWELSKGTNNHDTLGDLLPSGQQTPKDYLEAQDQSDTIAKYLSLLTDEQQQILKLKFGLIDDEELTHVEIAKRLNIKPRQCIYKQQQAFKRIQAYEQRQSA